MLLVGEDGAGEGSMWRHILLLVALAACGDGVDDDALGSALGAASACGDALEPADTRAPMFLYYGVYEKDAMRAANQVLAGSGSQVDGEVVVALNRNVAGCAGPASDAQAWRAIDPTHRKVAAVFDACELRDGVINAQRAIELFHSGHAYIAIDELAAQKTRTDEQKKEGLAKCVFGPNAWQNGGYLAKAFDKLVTDLADAGYDRRVILYANTYNLVDLYAARPAGKRLMDYSHVLGSCRKHCRVLGAQIYMNTLRVIGEVAPSDVHCHWNLGCFERVASELDAAAPGLRHRIISILGLSAASSHYNLPDHPQSLCDGGSLYRQYATIHHGELTQYQPGIGGYALSYVPQAGGFRMAQAKCLARLNGWACWPRPGETPCGECGTSLLATIRDFRADHPDFEDYAGVAPLPGIVEGVLGTDNKPRYAGAGPTAQTSGPDAFAQWYRHVDGVNLPVLFEMQLDRTASGSLVFESDAFFPADGQGWGEEGNPRNFHFTTEVHTKFAYGGGEHLTFTGDDDMWLFINRRLALDLGGTHPEASGTVDLDAMAKTLGIVRGRTYAMDIFHAERHTDRSNFRLETSIECFEPPK